MQNKFLTKKDAINITPFLDIMLVLFVIIIVVASFNNNFDSLKEKEEFKNLMVEVKRLNKEKKSLQLFNEKLRKENKTLKVKNNFLTKENRNMKQFLNQFTMKIIIYPSFLTINGVEYNFKDFKLLVRHGIIKKVQFYYSKDAKSIRNYRKLNAFLNKLDWN